MKIIVIVSALGLCCLTACDTAFDCDCTREFAAVTFQVVNDDGQLEPGVEVTITLERTGEILALDQPGADLGFLLVITDSQKSLIHPFFGDVIKVEGVREEEGFEVVFVVEVDECRCHVHKVSGPDTAVIHQGQTPN